MEYNVWVIRREANAFLDAEHDYEESHREMDKLFELPRNEYHDAMMDWNERMNLLREKHTMLRHGLLCMCILVSADDKAVIAIEKSIRRKERRHRFNGFIGDQERFARSYRNAVKNRSF